MCGGVVPPFQEMAFHGAQGPTVWLVTSSRVGCHSGWRWLECRGAGEGCPGVPGRSADGTAASDATAARQLLALSIGHSQEAHVQTKCWCGHALGSWGSHSLGPLSLLVMGTRDRAGRQAGRQVGQLSGC